jgi:hypothetical protein
LDPETEFEIETDPELELSGVIDFEILAEDDGVIETDLLDDFEFDGVFVCVKVLLFDLL